MNLSVRRQLAIWLFLCASMVFATLVVGGVTRLTHSGLSIVEWQPLVGTIPPLNQNEWQAVFDQYKLTPEFHKVNFDMSLDEFKSIFWWEYLHRLIGRIIGMVFLLPFLYFMIRYRLTRTTAARLAGIFVLGGLQGAMGWYMVKSGLVDNPRVSQYRLTAHLTLAFLIFASMMWVGLDILRPRVKQVAEGVLRRARHLGVVVTGVVFYMVVTGGFVAGIRAGKAYNTFPLMNGHVLPPESFLLDPWYLNFFNNMALVQFNHRLGAWLLAGLVPLLWWRVQSAKVGTRARFAAHCVLAWLGVQIMLGISTLLLSVPVVLGAAHQGGAMVLFGLVLWLNHELRVPLAFEAPSEGEAMSSGVVRSSLVGDEV